jgi:hypothetical protein
MARKPYIGRLTREPFSLFQFVNREAQPFKQPAI